MNDFERALQKLRHYVERKDFKGWDPFDGLNSKLFQKLPLLKKNKWARLAWVQFFKRSPVNFRPLTGVPEEDNPKGLALFILGYARLYRKTGEKEIIPLIRNLSERLLMLQSKGYSGAGWGYNFDWQARAFFQPKFTPMAVSTAYAAEALMHAADVLEDENLLQVALSAADFILNDLQRTYDQDGDFMFSYSPLDKSQIYNAGLLAAKTLIRIWKHTGNAELREEALKVFRYAAKRQKPDGSWTYGTLPHHQWTDNFHTGYNLEAYYVLKNLTGISDFDPIIKKGTDFYLRNFWTSEGIPRYFHDRTWPADMHNPAQLTIVLDKAGLLSHHKELAEKVWQWSINRMQAPDGRFYYQKHAFYTNKIPYMRWTQAWAFYGLSVLTA